MNRCKGNKMSKLREIVKNLALSKNRKIVETQPISDVNALIKHLWPQKTEHDLIRIGANGDGSYLLPNDLENIAACFSPGVSYVADFELAIAEKGIPCFMIDASITKPPVFHKLFTFQSLFLGTKTHEHFITLQDWVENSNILQNKDLLLQMDIEGAEWAVLLCLDIELLKRFRIIVIEFHDVDGIVERKIYQYMKAVFDKILDYFTVVHIHPNNNDGYITYHNQKIPRTIEMTLHRSDRIKQKEPARSFPHPLDIKNNPSAPDFSLPEEWFENIPAA